MKFLLCRTIRRASFTHSSKLEKVEGLKKMTAIYVALVVYMVVLFGVGLFYSKKNATINDFLLAGRDLGVVAATLTVTASLFGGGLLTGTAQYTYDSGVMMYIYGIVGSGGELLSGIVSAVVLVIVSLATQPKKTAA